MVPGDLENLISTPLIDGGDPEDAFFDILVAGS
jgi:hypothetical protein